MAGLLSAFILTTSTSRPLTTADACPGLLDLHEARDGHVARIRLPGGYLTGGTLRGLAALAGRFGNGGVDLTSRGNVQLRGVRAAQAGDMARRAAAAGLLPAPAHDRARNITASPLAGLAGHPDLRKLVHALDRAVRADPGLAALNGRFLFCLDDGTGRTGLSGCDAGLRLQPRGADLVVAGRQTGLSGPARQVVGHAIAVARAFLQQRRAVSASTGPGVMRVAGLPDGGAAITAALGGTLGRPVRDVTTRLPLGPLADGRPAAVVAAPLGRLTAAHLRMLGRMVRPGDAVRLAAAGRIVLPLAEPVDAALARLAGAGLLVSDDDTLSAVTACSGISCARSLADVRSVARRVPGLAAVHWAGCGRRCGLPADATAVVALSADQFAVGDGPVLQAAGPHMLATAAAPA